MTSEEHYSIEQRLFELRRSKGLSQEQLAGILGVSRQAVSKWESGQALPEVDKLIALSQLYTSSIDYILKGEAPCPTMAAPGDRRSSRQGSSKIGSLIISAVSLMLFAIAIFATFGQLSQDGYTMDIYGGMIIVSVGIMIFLIGIILAGGRIFSKVLFIANVLLAALLPALLVAHLFAGITGDTKTPVWPNSAVGIAIAVCAYLVICALASFFGIIRNPQNSTSR